ECPGRGGPRNGERLGQLALQQSLPVDHRAQHESLRRRQAEGLEGVAPFPLEPACESRGIEIQAVVEHGGQYKHHIVRYATIWGIQTNGTKGTNKRHWLTVCPIGIRANDSVGNQRRSAP